MDFLLLNFDTRRRNDLRITLYIHPSKLAKKKLLTVIS